MSIPGALRFIAAVRDDPKLAQTIRDLGPEASLEKLASEGASRGFEFSADDLRTAYKLDWKMRWARYFGPGNSDLERE